MRLTPRTFRVQWDVHAWPGVLASLLLFVVFFCGALSLFRSPLTVWQEPALQVPRPDGAPSFTEAQRLLEARGLTHAAFAESEDTPFLLAFVPGDASHAPGRYYVNPWTQEVHPERSRLADELYQMHFFYRIPQGMQLSGLFAIALLVVLISGILLHLKDLRRLWWTFRTGRGVRLAASDAHKALGVVGIPFTVMMAWSGALLSLSALLTSVVGQTCYRGDPHRVDALAGFSTPERPLRHIPATPLPWDVLVASARVAAHAPLETVQYLDLVNAGDASAWARVFLQGHPGGHYAYLDAVTGAVLEAGDQANVPAARFSTTMYDLHYARFGGRTVRFAYLLLALAGCAVIVTGNLVWLERRDPARARFGNRLLERLTSGVCAGLVFATSAYALGNRFLPERLGARADVEFGLFLAVWALSALAALCVTPRRSFGWLTGLSGAAFLSVVAADGVLHFDALTRVAAVQTADALWLVLGLSACGLALRFGRDSARRQSSQRPESSIT